MIIILTTKNIMDQGRKFLMTSTKKIIVKELKRL